MITQFEEQSLLTSPTTSKILQFTSDNILICGSGNRLMEYNLYNNTVKPIIQTRFNVKYFSVYNQQYYSSVDDQYNILCNGKHIKSKNQQIKQIKHSPDGKMIAIAYLNKLIIYNLEMEKIKVHSNKHKINGICWSPDSRFILSWGDDNSVIINNVFKLRLYTDIMLQAHKFKIASAFFLGSNIQYIITIDVLGKVCLWKFVTDYVTEQYEARQKFQKTKAQHHLGVENDYSEYSIDELLYMSDFEKNVHQGRFILEKKINIKEKLVKHFAAIKSVAYHTSNMMIIGMKNGVLTLFKIEPSEDPFLIQIQSFQITQTQIDNLAINKNGNWIALGMRNSGQLIVWEWRSQSYILNQQSLSYETTCCTISQDLTTIAVGTLGGIIRLYDQTSNFCIAKFNDQHSSKVTGIKYCPSKQGVLLSCSLDGTVRAYDTIRLKCFRVMQPEILNQLQCLDVEPSGDLICVGGFDPYEVYVFSLQTGQLVEVISGHQAPITSIKFIQAEEKVLLISGSWDKTIRIHDLYARGMKEGSGGDSMLHNSEVTALATRSNQIAVATMGGELVIWDVNESLILFTFDVHRDVQGGRISKETLAAQKNQNLKYFVAIEFSKDGQYLIGGGNSKFICLYDMKYRILIRRFIISNNYSLDGMKLKVNFKTIDKENKNIEESDDEKQKDNLPGAKTFDVSKRSSKRVPVSVFNLQFTESNREFIVSSSEGVSIFGSAKRRQYFDPLDIDETVSLEVIQKQINQQNYTEALILSLKLNEASILDQVFNSIPVDSIINTVPAIPESLIVRLLETIIRSMQIHRSIESCLIWIQQILIDFAPLIKGSTANKKVQNMLQEVLKQVRLDFNRIKNPIRKCVNILEYLSS
ncbi:unnamed protein product [Paramecium octaurelia]|uniref:Small-subunit processome Utp12 domain-containing protein n=1 Tax=Paramecium octaurelia TaxID=43137 RepID=A0A8S1SXS3_PAROT|nr:unnamed protein product [Paramecium octaurelia]